MAQDQRVDVLFAAQVTGQNQLEKLTLAVEKLRQETEQLKSANTTLASSTDAVIRNGVRYNNALDAQAKALRQARQGTQQLGMQINDFATSVSTGASPVQAFNQQLGQLGFALAMMGGTAGKIGSFLAGPWGAAIVIATMALGPFIDSLFEVSEETKAAEEAAKKMDSAIEARISSEYNLRLALADTAEEYRNIRLEMMANAAQAVKTASVELNARLKVLNALQAEQDALEAQAKGAGGLRAQTEMTTGQILDRARVGGGINKSITAVKAQITALETATSKLNAATIDVAQAQRRVDKKGADRGSRQRISEAEKEAKRMREAYEKEQQKAVTDFMDLLGRANQKTMTQYQRDIYELQGTFNKMGMDDRIKYQEDFNKALGELDLAQIARDNEELNKSLKDGILPELAETLGKVTPLQDAIITRNEELQNSFESIGNAVSEAFKGMLTGAMSWKDGMRSLIGTVIEELWKLFVVQKIVGFISGALNNAFGAVGGGGMSSAGSATGFSVPIGGGPSFGARANGGSVMSNSPYMVGERGPELFIPGGNGTIIPNKNLGSGKGGNSFNINVDARGSADPAAVRAQVQQGILEAAPAIIAAAEARTVGGLRRPRLGGVIQ